MSTQQYNTHVGLVIFDMPWGKLTQHAWDNQTSQMTQEELVAIIRQAGVCQSHLDNGVTFVLWHQTSDAKMVRDALTSEHYSHLTDFFWHKKDHCGSGPQRSLVPSVECATIGFYKSQLDCYITHPSNPRDRHNFIDIPHITKFALDPEGGKVNGAEKPRALAKYMVEHYCPVGGNVLVIGAGAGGDVFGALDGGANVVAVERDPHQFKCFAATATAKLQEEFDRLEEEQRGQAGDGDDISSRASTASSAVPDSQRVSNPDAAPPRPPSSSTKCNSCGVVLTEDETKNNRECDLCQFPGPLCSKHQFHDKDTNIWYCEEHQGAIGNADTRAQSQAFD